MKSSTYLGVIGLDSVSYQGALDICIMTYFVVLTTPGGGSHLSCYSKNTTI